MELIWYAALGLAFAVYLVLGGYDYGVGLLLSGVRDDRDRRAVLTAVGPYFLGNEVWLVAAVGILFGAFPRLEGELLSGYYPAVVAALVGVILVTVAVQLRGRPEHVAARARWDRTVVAGSALAAAGWGALLGGLLQGLPIDAGGHVAGIGHLATPFVAATAITLVSLVAVQGATFLALRMPDARWAALARRLVGVALGAVAVATLLGLLSADVRAGQRLWVAAPLLVLVSALMAVRSLAPRRPGWAFVASSLALVAPVLVVGLGRYPAVLVSTIDPAATLTVTEAAAAPSTLRLLSWVAAPFVPVLIGFQAMCWWVFRGRIDGKAPVYW
ncbi:cytochrome d ubiquinol oxidase subunit II [Asanoa sp. WMMD1127]|uniref:cytochrome d ubiquinol oxidase subunit II n=1 Tax=Asanoa sp. WMMD1127 TaxID=3016107 RepID=UPI0024178A0B|nr:cytochrome d ubiquinol oxidase subunit II [Asanoa sp. WMMD1127]MDG4822788.1 cytochrome d ubiquinol oxidase subunit II [Asanoa sp. WMMD1127]